MNLLNDIRVPEKQKLSDTTYGLALIALIFTFILGCVIGMNIEKANHATIEQAKQEGR